MVIKEMKKKLHPQLVFHRKVASSSGHLMFYIPKEMHGLFEKDSVYEIKARIVG